MSRTDGGGRQGRARALASRLNGRPLVLVGMMGAGKTTVGRRLAARLGRQFIDSDEEIVKAANMSIAEIFARDGEAFFREKETRVIGRLLDEKRGVLSTGGGAFLSERNRTMISEKGVSVWLTAPVDGLFNLVSQPGVV